MAKRKKMSSVSREDLSKYTLPSEKIEVKKAPVLVTDKEGDGNSSSFVKGTRGKIWTGFMILMIVSAISASVLIFKNKTNNAQSVEQMLVEETPVPAVSNESEINNSDFALEVLNGSGISGEAAKLQGLLEESGFKVSGIGNAQEPVERTIILSKDDLPDEFVNNLQDLLGKYYLLAPEVEINEIQDSEVVITIGRQVK
jgi:hypothetical protein